MLIADKCNGQVLLSLAKFRESGSAESLGVDGSVGDWFSLHCLLFGGSPPSTK